MVEARIYVFNCILKSVINILRSDYLGVFPIECSDVQIRNFSAALSLLLVEEGGGSFLSSPGTC